MMSADDILYHRITVRGGELTNIERRALECIANEFIRARRFPLFNSEHEGHSVIEEEFDELWDAIKNNKTTHRIDRLAEAMQIGAMALKYLVSFGGEGTLEEIDA